MSIVTKTGDQGETSLMYGRRVPKNDPRVESYGAVDELTAALGLARAISDDKFVAEQIFAIQKDLINIMGELATLPEDRERYSKDGFHITDAKMVDRVTAVIVDLEKDKSLYPKDWVIPGASRSQTRRKRRANRRTGHGRSRAATGDRLGSTISNVECRISAS